ncbi:hypothetical protein VSDG_03023 [Cytospora chrysosperma]|uniref:F-box domain-containing protein n=1 Tax=Cytospora chrysosperma TaxID=252740 RepID=A0A423W8K5_CYTCH|nr:hypothetical protein VSDG_03023 [Valsa sordida]
MASISKLPSEVVVLIAKACRVPEKSALARSNRQMNELITPELYKYNIQKEGGSAVFWAAEHGCIETLERLVSFGAEVNDITASRFRVVHRPYYPYGTRCLHDTFFSPLHIAAKFGQDGAVKWLLDHGARIEAMAHNLCACQEGVMDVANDSDFDPRLSPLATPFHIALCNGNITTAKLLVSRGAGVDVGVATPLHTAARFNNADAVSFLLEKGLVDVDELDRHGYAPLHLACMEFEDLSSLEKLLEFGAELETLADDDRTPLAFACERGYFKAALKLLEHGADPKVEWNGQTPIQAAALSMRLLFPHEPPPDPERWEDEREELIRRLLVLGVDINEVGGMGTTALHIAAGQQSLARTLQCLLDAGADLNARDDMQQTPLHVAFESRHLASVTVKIVPLLQRGGRLDERSRRGYSAFECALDIARLRGEYSIIDSIFQHATTANFRPGFLDSIVMSSYKSDRLDECRVLCRHGARIFLTNDEVRRQLCASIKAKDVPRTHFHLDIFPNILTPCEALKIALHDYDVIKEEEMAIITAVLGRPDLDVGDNGADNTSHPLHVACKYHHSLEIIGRLLEKSRQINIFDADYETPLSYAVKEQCPHTVRMLLRHGADPFMAPSEKDWHSYTPRTGSRFDHRPLFSPRDHLTAFHRAIGIRSKWMLHHTSCHHDTGEPHLLEILLENHSLPPLPTDPSLQSYINLALGDPETLEILLRKGADPNVGGHCNQPPLLHALKLKDLSQMPEAVAMLLHFGADVNQKDVDGSSFLGVFKAAAKAVSELSNWYDEFVVEGMGSAGSIVRHFQVVADTKSGEERIEARPDDEVEAACRDFECREQAYRDQEVKKYREERRERQANLKAEREEISRLQESHCPADLWLDS